MDKKGSDQWMILPVFLFKNCHLSRKVHHNSVKTVINMLINCRAKCLDKAKSLKENI